MMQKFRRLLPVDRNIPFLGGKVGVRQTTPPLKRGAREGLPYPRQLSLHTRVSLVFTALAATLLVILAGLWLHGARNATHEEVEAASRVSQQWLQALAGEMHQLPPAALPERLLAVVKPLGRIRANALEVIAADGALLYRSPAPSYKAGRAVPGWFARLVTPGFAPRRLEIGALQLVLYPDASRSVIDAWDDLLAMAGWAVLLLAAIFCASRRALDHACARWPRSCRRSTVPVPGVLIPACRFLRHPNWGVCHGHSTAWPTV